MQVCVSFQCEQTIVYQQVHGSTTILTLVLHPLFPFHDDSCVSSSVVSDIVLCNSVNNTQFNYCLLIIQFYYNYTNFVSTNNSLSLNFSPTDSVSLPTEEESLNSTNTAPY